MVAGHYRTDGGPMVAADYRQWPTGGPQPHIISDSDGKKLARVLVYRIPPWKQDGIHWKKTSMVV